MYRSIVTRIYLATFLIGGFSFVEKVFSQDLNWGDFFELPSVSEEKPIAEAPRESVIVLDAADEDEIIYIGADGRTGEDSPPAIFPGSAARSGSSGSSGGQITLIVKKLPRRAFISSKGGYGGNGGRGANGLRGRDGVDGRNAGLFRSSKPGSDATDGGRGGNGSHGGNGGSGGYVRILFVPDDPAEFETNWKSRFEVDVSGGVGGEPGQPGSGGRGGHGGKGGKKFWSSKRESSGRDGMDGEGGKFGRPGENGEEGRVEFFEIENMDDWIVEEYQSLIQANSQI